MEELKNYTLAEFLAEESTNFKSRLPLVHSSQSNNLLEILAAGKIEVTKCDTFKEDNLAYFFHGRPSYRKFLNKPKLWQLPVVLLLRSTCLLNIRRIFPFDSGAFASGRLPQYIGDFGSEGFELSNQPNPMDLLIDIFWGSDTEYFHGRSKPEAEVIHRRGLDVRHAQAMALCAMYNREDLTADDRALAIELQTDEDVPLKDQLLGVVMPRPFFDLKGLRDSLRSANVEIGHYDVYPISTEAYMTTVYEEVKKIYRKLGLIDG